MANVCCSIESEPRTLNQGQLIHAREMAADAAQKMEKREATTMFIEGPRPPLKEIECQIEALQKGSVQAVEGQDEKAQPPIIEIPCQCSSVVSIESPDESNFKEPVSAPF